MDLVKSPGIQVPSKQGQHSFPGPTGNPLSALAHCDTGPKAILSESGPKWKFFKVKSKRSWNSALGTGEALGCLWVQDPRSHPSTVWGQTSKVPWRGQHLSYISKGQGEKPQRKGALMEESSSC